MRTLSVVWADNNDMDQHAHSRTVIWTFVVCCSE